MIRFNPDEILEVRRREQRVAQLEARVAQLEQQTRELDEEGDVIYDLAEEGIDWFDNCTRRMCEMSGRAEILFNNLQRMRDDTSLRTESNFDVVINYAQAMGRDMDTLCRNFGQRHSQLNTQSDINAIRVQVQQNFQQQAAVAALQQGDEGDD